MYRDAPYHPRFSVHDFFMWMSFLTMPLVCLPQVWAPLNTWTWGSPVPYFLFLHWGVPGTTYGLPDPHSVSIVEARGLDPFCFEPLWLFQDVR